MPEEKYDIKLELVAVCHRLEEKGFVIAAEGNVTARLGNGNIISTRRGINKGKVTDDDLIEVTPHGEPLINRHQPSTELKMHLFIYEQRRDVNAVVHAHPVYATGFATARIPLTECILPEIVVGLGSIPLAGYATPSTDEVAASLSPYIRTRDAVLLANHGVVTAGGGSLGCILEDGAGRTCGTGDIHSTFAGGREAAHRKTGRKTPRRLY